MKSFLSMVIAVLLLATPRALAIQDLPTELRLQTLGPDSAAFPGLLHYEGGELRGRYREILDCVGGRLGVTIRYTGMPFVRAQRNVESASVDGFFPANLTARRDQFATPSAPLLTDRKILLAREDFALSPPSPDRLSSYVGAMRGAQYEQALAERIGHPLALVDSYDQLVRMLQTSRIGALVASEMFIDATLSTFEQLPPLTREPLETAPMYAYFSAGLTQQYPRFLRRFNQALDDCRPPPDQVDTFSSPF